MQIYKHTDTKDRYKGKVSFTQVKLMIYPPSQSLKQSQQLYVLSSFLCCHLELSCWTGQSYIYDLCIYLFICQLAVVVVLLIAYCCCCCCCCASDCMLLLLLFLLCITQQQQEKVYIKGLW